MLHAALSVLIGVFDLNGWLGCTATRRIKYSFISTGIMCVVIRWNTCIYPPESCNIFFPFQASDSHFFLHTIHSFTIADVAFYSNFRHQIDGSACTIILWNSSAGISDMPIHVVKHTTNGNGMMKSGESESRIFFFSFSFSLCLPL